MVTRKQTFTAEFKGQAVGLDKKSVKPISHAPKEYWSIIFRAPAMDSTSRNRCGKEPIRGAYNK